MAYHNIKSVHHKLTQGNLSMSNTLRSGSIVMTGGTAGFGLVALRMVAENTQIPIFVGARRCR